MKKIKIPEESRVVISNSVRETEGLVCNSFKSYYRVYLCSYYL